MATALINLDQLLRRRVAACEAEYEQAKGTFVVGVAPRVTAYVTQEEVCRPP